MRVGFSISCVRHAGWKRPRHAPGPLALIVNSCQIQTNPIALLFHSRLESNGIFTRRSLVTPSTAFLDVAVRVGVNVHQFYSLDMPWAHSPALADIFAFEGMRAIGEPIKYASRFTHPQHDLSRTEYLKRPAAFVTQPSPRNRWSRVALLRNGPKCCFFLENTEQVARDGEQPAWPR